MDGNRLFLNFLLRCGILLINIIVHVYDYVTYPIYYVVYHPWLVRQHKKEIHSDFCRTSPETIVYSSKQEPTEINALMKRNKLNTMAKVFDYLCENTVNNNREALGTREILAEDDEVQPNGKVFKKYAMGNYNWITFDEFGKRSKNFTRGLTKLGLKARDKIVLLAETRADWLVCASGCFRRSITIVTLYTNLGDSGLIHGINETEVDTIITTYDLLSKIQKILPKIPQVKTIIYMESLAKKEADLSKFKDAVKIHTMSQVLEMGQDIRILEDEYPQPEDTAIIMYTSGSTGVPKGVILSHFNMIAALSSLMNIAEFYSTDRYIGYLPLAHVLELLAECSCLLYNIRIGYSSPLTLTNKSSKIKIGSKGDANVLRPTLICCVPLILERIYKSIKDTMHRQGWAVEELFEFFVNYKIKWTRRGFDTPILNKTLFRKIRYFLGGRVRLMLSGGAPLAPETHELTQTCLCVPVMQGFGLTETCACATVTSPKDKVTGRVGPPLMNVKVKLVNWEEGNYTVDDKPFPRGEIHVGADNVANGYFKNEEKTKEDFYFEDDIHWFRTGDIGEVHADGVLKIIDRKKDLVKLQHGEYVSYGKVESEMKRCSIIDNVCLHGDSNRSFLVALIIPNKDNFLLLTKSLGKASTKMVELCKDKTVVQEVLKIIQEHCTGCGLLTFEIPQAITLICDEWTPDSGLVTAAFKLRRKFIEERYKKDINAMYK